MRRSTTRMIHTSHASPTAKQLQAANKKNRVVLWMTPKYAINPNVSKSADRMDSKVAVRLIAVSHLLE